MMRSMYAAVSGLRTHQSRMDVIGNNIGNVNTPGFKKSRATFQDIFYQTLRGGSAPSGDLGGTNPQQIGLGVTLGGVDVMHTQGAAAATGNGSDLMVQGEGLFILSDGTNTYFSRDGSFSFDAGDGTEATLVDAVTGFKVMGVDGNPVTIDNGYQSFSFDNLGQLSFVGDDGIINVNTTQVALAKFPNPAGLKQVGQNLYQWDQAAGDEVDGDNTSGGAPATGGRGSVIPGALEMANVELAQEFTDMIVTQRGFQANARVISTSDEMLQELANLRR